MISVSLKSIVFLYVFILLGLSACSKSSDEQVLSTYPDGKKKETAIYVNKKPNQKMLKSFEYYQTGEKKKEFSYQDNLFHGPWTYWYKNGKKMGEGIIENKAINLGLSSGTERYYWPGGNIMLRSETVGGKLKPGTTAVFYDEQGKEFSDETRPDALVDKTRNVIDRW